MCDPHRRIGLVDVLTTGTRGAVGVDLQIIILDRDAFDLVNDRRDLNPSERCLPAAGGVERRESDEAMDAALGAEKPVGVFASGLEGG